MEVFCAECGAYITRAPSKIRPYKKTYCGHRCQGLHEKKHKDARARWKANEEIRKDKMRDPEYRKRRAKQMKKAYKKYMSDPEKRTREYLRIVLSRKK